MSFVASGGFTSVSQDLLSRRTTLRQAQKVISDTPAGPNIASLPLNLFRLPPLIGIAGPVSRNNIERRLIPRPGRDKRVFAAETAVTGRKSGERRTGGPLESFVTEVKAFLVKPAGIAVVGLSVVSLVFFVSTR